MRGPACAHRNDLLISSGRFRTLLWSRSQRCGGEWVVDTVRAGLVDWHTHAISPQLGVPSTADDYAWPTTALVDDHRAVISVGGRRYREVDDRCWSAARRVADMDADGVAV